MGLDMNLTRLNKKYKLDWKTVYENEQEFAYWRKYYELDSFILSVCESIEENEYYLIKKENLETIINFLEETVEHNVYKLQALCVFEDIIKNYNFDEYYLIYSRC